MTSNVSVSRVSAKRKKSHRKKKNHGKKNTEKVTLVEPSLKKHSFVLPHNIVTVL